jgi:hypothetical protein
MHAVAAALLLSMREAEAFISHLNVLNIQWRLALNNILARG